MITARACHPHAVVQFDRVRLALTCQSRRSLGHHHLRAELLRLRMRAAGQLESRHTGRKAKVVFDA
jgi:hypothetical protein